MKRFLSALTLCSSLLVLLSFVLFPHVAAQKDDDVLAKLLNLPAPPPPNPFIKLPYYLSRKHDREREGPPADDAPIEEQIEFWTRNTPQPLRYNPEPSDKVRALLLKEVESDPSLLPSLMGVFNNDLDAADTIKRIYDSEGTTGVFDKETRKSIKQWLTFNSPHYSNELERTASQITDTNEYLTSQDELLALTRVDFDKARPIIDRLYGDGSLKTSRVLAKWALYRRALLTNSTGDIERYRDELKDIVEDKSALAGMRDLAFDALVSEKDWPGRDEWYYSLMADETLAELRVDGSLYTGLTTLVLRSPGDKYTAKMIELLKSDSAAVRSAAVRNLIASIERGGPEIVKALLPWLEDRKWAKDANDARGTLVRKLAEYEMPESVPGLIKVLEEKHSGPRYAANMAANTAANVAWNAANALANTVDPASNSNRALDAGPPELVDHYPFRSSAVYALTTQKDARAVQPLRRALSAVEPYERVSVVRALLASNGFTISEQLDAIDSMARRGPGDESYMGAAIAANYPAFNGEVRKPGPPTAMEIRAFVGQQLIQGDLVSDALARSTVDRIEALNKRDPQLAAAYRKIVLAWKNAAINTLFLRDVKRGTADLDTIVRLLGSRKMLREKHSPDVFDLRTGTPLAVGIAACLLEDNGDYETILDTGSFETKTALLACSRLIRAKLGVEKVAVNLDAKQPLLAKAAEQYLISEDSPQAREIVLSRHPNEAMILGATTMFAGKDEAAFELISALFMSVGNENVYNGWFETSDSGDVFNVEKLLQDEVKMDRALLGVYAYDDNYIRIYNDRVIYSWDEDDSRYRERPLRKEEFDDIKSYLTDSRADELPPFIYCVGAYCEGKELLMLGATAVAGFFSRVSCNRTGRNALQIFSPASKSTFLT